MSIYDSIKDAIWGHPAAVPPIATAPGQPAPLPGQPGQPAVTLPGTAPGTPTGVMPTVPVDVHAVLSAMAEKNPQTLDWEHSIVDLMKLLNLDSSFQHRTALAKELGFTGNMADSAAMNTWLYSQVMNKLAASGGKVPDSLLR